MIDAMKAAMNVQKTVTTVIKREKECRRTDKCVTDKPNWNGERDEERQKCVFDESKWAAPFKLYKFMIYHDCYCTYALAFLRFFFFSPSLFFLLLFILIACTRVHGLYCCWNCTMPFESIYIIILDNVL